MQPPPALTVGSCLQQSTATEANSKVLTPRLKERVTVLPHQHTWPSTSAVSGR